MSTAIAEPAVCEEQVRKPRERRPACGGISLGELLARAHEGSADCPVCGGSMAASLLDAECGDCGSRVS